MTTPRLAFIMAAFAALIFSTEHTYALELDKLNRDLVQLDDEKLKKAKDIDLGSKKYVAFYYSAHWCPPCRAFTPELSKFYDKVKKKHGDDFELVFVSSDKNEKAMRHADDWVVELQRGIKNSDGLIYVMTRDSVQEKSV